MNWYRIAQVDNLRFENNHIDSHSGQHDFNLLAKIPDRTVGMIEYSVFDDEVFINNMIVAPDLRRKKIATRMIEELKRLNAGMIVHWGMTSEEGSALKKSLEGQ